MVSTSGYSGAKRKRVEAAPEWKRPSQDDTGPAD
jgi:hypothetical protein